jgi:hypothetical protein
MLCPVCKQKQGSIQQTSDKQKGRTKKRAIYLQKKDCDIGLKNIKTPYIPGLTIRGLAQQDLKHN